MLYNMSADGVRVVEFGTYISVVVVRDAARWSVCKVTGRQRSNERV